MHEYIDQLIIDGKTEEACLLIEDVWRKKALAENEIVVDLNRRLDSLEKHMLKNATQPESID